MRYGAAMRKQTRHGKRCGRLTPCDAAPSGGEERRRRGSVSGDAIWRGDEEVTRHGKRCGRLTRCDTAPSGGEGRRRRRGSVSGDVIWRGDEDTHEVRRAARPAHPLRRGAERGRGEAEEGKRERRCDMARRLRNAEGTARGAVGSPAATRRRAGARGGGGGGAA